MPRNGSGTYSLPQAPFVAGTTISSAAVNSDFSDIAIALTGSLPRDGQAGMSGQFKASDGSTFLPSISFVNDTASGFFRVADDIIGLVIGGVQVGTISAAGIVAPVASGVPVGFMGDYAGGVVPAQWLLCFGQAVSRTTYALLFTAIGTTYGSGDGSTTFNLPDGRGTIFAGADNMGGVVAGRFTTPFFGSDPTVLGNRGGGQSDTLTAAQIPTINSLNNGSPSYNLSSGLTSTVNLGLGSSTTPGGTFSFFAPTAQGAASVTGFTTITANTLSTVSSNTGGTAHPNVQPTLIINKIIYAGA